MVENFDTSEFSLLEMHKGVPTVIYFAGLTLYRGMLWFQWNVRVS